MAKSLLYYIKQICLVNIISNITNNKNELSMSIRTSFCICRVIYTFFELSEWLYSCFTQFGGSSNSLNFDKICGTAPFTFEIPGKLLHENMIPSRMKITCYLHVEKITIAMAP